MTPEDIEDPGPPLTGASIKVLTWAPVTGVSTLNFPDVPVVALAYAKMINRSGGFGGRPLEVLVCDERSQPVIARECAQRAVNEGVVAVVGSVSQHGEAYLPILTAAGIAHVGGTALSPTDHTSAVSFPITGGVPTASAGAGLLALRMGCKRTALVRRDIPATFRVGRYLAAALGTAGASVVAEVPLPIDGTDLDLKVAAATKNSDCIVLDAPEQDTQRFLSLFQQTGAKQRIISFPSSMTGRVAAQFPDIARNAGFVDYFPPVQNAVWQSYRDAIARVKERETVDVGGTVQRNTWTAYEVFSRIVKPMTSVDARSLLAALKAATALDTDGLLPTLNLRTPFRKPGLERLFNRSVAFHSFKDGTFAEMQPGFVDTTPLLQRTLVSP